MAHLYVGLIEAVQNLRDKGELRIIKGPFWFLQLWLNAMFRSHMLSTIPSIVPNHVVCFGPTTCTKKEVLKKTFLEYFSVFSSIAKFQASFLHFLPGIFGLSGFEPLLNLHFNPCPYHTAKTFYTLLRCVLFEKQGS